MDSITHVVLGAVAGEAMAGKKLGKRAMLYGALAQSLPDIDFIASLWLSPAENLLAHRGITHSFLFGIAATVALSALGARTHKAHNLSFSGWNMFIGAEIVLHLLLDACNAYGVGWLEPFFDRRFSFHILFVADPFFSIGLGTALLALITLSSKSPSRKFWMVFGLSTCVIYFAYAVMNKSIIEQKTSAYFKSRNIDYIRLLTTPTPMNTWLWFVAAEDEKGYYITHASVFDKNVADQDVKYFPKHKEFGALVIDSTELKPLLKFSQDYYTFEQRGDTLIFNDLRFGQIAGWHDPKAKFVFHYYLNNPEANLLVIQRGRFSNWNRTTFNSMIDRMKGR